jgi:hypothetical protein
MVKKSLGGGSRSRELTNTITGERPLDTVTVGEKGWDHLSSLNTEPIGNNAEENTLFFSGGSNTFI